MKEFVIIDLEWTSWKENYNKRKDPFNRRKVWQKKEIIQIGAIRFNKYYKILDTLNLYVKPKFNPILSNYIIKLTGISQKIIDQKGNSFKRSYKILKKFCGTSKIFCNGDDYIIIKKNLNYNDMNDNKVKIKNIRKILNKKYKIPKKFLISGIIHTYFGIKFKKKEMHNAVYDCMNILKALKKIKFSFN